MINLKQVTDLAIITTATAHTEFTIINNGAIIDVNISGSFDINVFHVQFSFFCKHALQDLPSSGQAWDTITSASLNSCNTRFSLYIPFFF